ncbi:MAG: trimeric intracellular cation channel family protein [Pseudomonadota bacterium]
MYSFDTVLYVFFYVALVAEAMTAALAAGRRKMDWMGVAMLAAITALGGGTTRDVLLGHYPLTWVANPWLLAIAGGAALVTIALASVVHRFTMLFLVLDAIGLAVFTIIGCEVALQMKLSLPIVIVSGMITGCVGGVLRDVLCNDVPLLFRSELYATVSIATGLLFVAQLSAGLPQSVATVIAFAAGLSFRLLAIRFRWEMPKFVYERGPH